MPATIKSDSIYFGIACVHLWNYRLSNDRPRVFGGNSAFDRKVGQETSVRAGARADFATDTKSIRSE